MDTPKSTPKKNYVGRDEGVGMEAVEVAIEGTIVAAMEEDATLQEQLESRELKA